MKSAALYLSLALSFFAAVGCDVPAEDGGPAPAGEHHGGELRSIAPAPDGGLPACTLEYDPVCGEDGHQYPNACAARLAGQSKLTPPPCKVPDPRPAPVPGTCRSNDDCQEGSYCKKAIGDCAGVGTCTPRLAGCPLKPTAVLPATVCGCDGVTYVGGTCAAARAGTSVASSGRCPPPDRPGVPF